MSGRLPWAARQVGGGDKLAQRIRNLTSAQRRELARRLKLSEQQRRKSERESQASHAKFRCADRLRAPKCHPVPMQADKVSSAESPIPLNDVSIGRSQEASTDTQSWAMDHQLLVVNSPLSSPEAKHSPASLVTSSVDFSSAVHSPGVQGHLATDRSAYADDPTSAEEVVVAMNTSPIPISGLRGTCTQDQDLRVQAQDAATQVQQAPVCQRSPRARVFALATRSELPELRPRRNRVFGSEACASGAAFGEAHSDTAVLASIDPPLSSSSNLEGGNTSSKFEQQSELDAHVEVHTDIAVDDNSASAETWTRELPSSPSHPIASCDGDDPDEPMLSEPRRSSRIAARAARGHRESVPCASSLGPSASSKQHASSSPTDILQASELASTGMSESQMVVQPQSCTSSRTDLTSRRVSGRGRSRAGNDGSADLCRTSSIGPPPGSVVTMLSAPALRPRPKEVVLEQDIATLSSTSAKQQGYRLRR